jgi:hypothetical protein
MTQNAVGLNLVNPKHVGYTGSLRPSGDESGDAWFTPSEIIELARFILNGIDLDPFSSDEANLGVGAKRIFSLQNSAFDQQRWTARTIFMNPPYSRGLCAKAVRRLLHEFNAKSFRCALVLVNNMTDTTWFHDLANKAQRRCDFRGRISFVTTDNKRISGNTRGQSFFLLSRNHKQAVNRFDARMPEHGLVYGSAMRSVSDVTGWNGGIHRQARRGSRGAISGGVRL